MGTDIHAVAQAKINGAWFDIESKFDDGRHYKLFAHLAGVRNGVGFAGCKAGDAVNPIQEHRGFPSDFETDEYGEDHNGQWMGDHSFGWVSGNEIMSHDWGQGHSSGIISINQYAAWDGKEPDRYCGGISGNNVNLSETPDDINSDTTHVRVTWKNSATSFDYFVTEIDEMMSSYGDDIRIVFGFDS